jgi:outer membrane protein assembly factor BamD
MTDPKPTVAPTIINRVTEDFKGAFSNTNAPVDHAPIGTDGAAPAPDSSASAAPATAAPATPAAPAAPLAFQPVGDGSGAAGTSEVTPGAATESTGSGARIGGVEVLTGTPNATPTPVSVPTPSVTTDLHNAATPSDAPAANGAPDPNYGLKAVGPVNAALPPVEKPTAAPATINTITAPTPPAQAAPANGKKVKPAPDFDKSEESSSKHKKKKGIKKIIPPNPF